eukprot:6284886-Amphidinium_carterae.1
MAGRVWGAKRSPLGGLGHKSLGAKSTYSKATSCCALVSCADCEHSNNQIRWLCTRCSQERGIERCGGAPVCIQSSGPCARKYVQNRSEPTCQVSATSSCVGSAALAALYDSTKLASANCW